MDLVTTTMDDLEKEEDIAPRRGIQQRMGELCQLVRDLWTQAMRPQNTTDEHLIRLEAKLDKVLNTQGPSAPTQAKQSYAAVAAMAPRKTPPSLS